MARRRKFTQQRINEIRDAFYEWQLAAGGPDSPTSEDFAYEQGISKAWLYQLARQDWDLSKSTRPSGRETQIRSLEAQMIALGQKHYEMSVRMAELSRKLEELEARQTR